MAEEQEETTEEAVPEEKEKKPLPPIVKKLALYGGILIGQAALAFALAHFVILPRLPDSGIADSLAALEPVEEVEEAGERGTIIMMEDVIVNLVDEEGTHFLKVATGLEFSESKLEAEITERMPELRGLVIDHFSSRSVAEVVRRDGRERVKRELLDDFNSRLTQGQLLNLYFSDFVVQ
jgi:flagellar protein FliL